jgi:hypothetical protein
VSSGPAPRGLDPEWLRARLRVAASDAEVFDRLLDALEPMAERLVLLLLRGGALVAHRGRGIDEQAVAQVRVPVAEAPALLTLIEKGGPYLGPLPSQFEGLLEDVTRCLCLPITLGKRAVGVVLAGRLDPSLVSAPPPFERVREMVDLALHIGHLRGRLSRA